MSSQSVKRMHTAIEKHFSELMDNKLKRLKGLAYWDLQFGPLNGCDVCGADTNDACTCGVKWEGFEKATETLHAWVEEFLPSQVWFDADYDYIALSEPESEKCLECHGDGDNVEGKCQYCGGSGWIEPYTEETYLLDRNELKKIVFGKDLAGYV